MSCCITSGVEQMAARWNSTTRRTHAGRMASPARSSPSLGCTLCRCPSRSTAPNGGRSTTWPANSQSALEAGLGQAWEDTLQLTSFVGNAKTRPCVRGSLDAGKRSHGNHRERVVTVRGKALLSKIDELAAEGPLAYTPRRHRRGIAGFSTAGSCLESVSPDCGVISISARTRGTRRRTSSRSGERTPGDARPGRPSRSSPRSKRVMCFCTADRTGKRLQRFPLHGMPEPHRKRGPIGRHT
jgi:hypothetical protein